MADEPWRANFPVCTDPVSKLQHLIIWQKPIEDARAELGVLPTMCHVVGMDRKGQHRKFTISVAEYRTALLSPKHMIEANTIRGPSGVLVDHTGEALR
jgi:hypothetical protein